MNTTIIRFEALRFVRQPGTWLLVLFLLGSATLPWFDADSAVKPVVPTMVISFLFGLVASVRGRQDVRADGMGSEPQYLLSRAGTRSQILVSRWVFHALVGVAVWSILTVALAARGKLSGQSQDRVGWGAVAVLEAAGHDAIFAPKDRDKYTRWIGEGRPSTRRTVRVELPWSSATALALTFLAFLLGVVTQIPPGPPRTRWHVKRLGVPVPNARVAAIAGGALLALAGIFFPVHLAWIAATLYVHLGIVVALAFAAITLFGSLLIRAWRRADF